MLLACAMFSYMQTQQEPIPQGLGMSPTKAPTIITGNSHVLYRISSNH